MENVLIEMIVTAHLTGAALLTQIGDQLPDVKVDASYEPVEMTPREEDLGKLSQDQKVVVVRGVVAAEMREGLSEIDGILHVWSDGQVAPFDASTGGLTMGN